MINRRLVCNALYLPEKFSNFREIQTKDIKRFEGFLKRACLFHETVDEVVCFTDENFDDCQMKNLIFAATTVLGRAYVVLGVKHSVLSY